MKYENCHSKCESSQKMDFRVGQRNVPFGAFSWRVLDVRDGKALLLAERILEERLYHNSRVSITWENCDLRKYLNGSFFQAFSRPEQNRIAPVYNTNAPNPWYGTAGGNRTMDRVFLLSIDEVVKYFGDSGDLGARNGWDWVDEKWVFLGRKGFYINDQYNENRMGITQDGYGGSAWLLRSPGYDDSSAAIVTSSGALFVIGDDVDYKACGVRPALWLNQ